MRESLAMPGPACPGAMRGLCEAAGRRIGNAATVFSPFSRTAGGLLAMNRRFFVLLAILAIVLAGGLELAVGRGHDAKPTPPPRQAKATPPVRPSAVESGLLPWRLQAPLSREVVLPRAGAHGLVVLGGLESGASSTDAIELLDTRNGVLSPHGTLLQATHDAAGATLGGRQLVIGGGTTAPARSTQIETGARTSEGGALAGARADAGAVTIGRSVYVVGGYDGSAMDREVVATTDGRAYRNVAALPIPVRYPALAVLGSQIYVFGGLGANGRPSDAVQLVDPAGRTAHVIGRLPRPLDGAAAGVLGGTIYLAGGRTAAGPTKAVYAFQPRGTSLLRAGSLRVGVAFAGAAVSNGRLWIVGGESSGQQPIAAVQMVVPNKGFGRAGDPGAGSPFAGDKLLIADRGADRLLPHQRPEDEADPPPDRSSGTVRARPAGRTRLAERRHAPRGRQPARLGDQRQLDRRAHALGAEGLGRAPRDRLPLGSAAARA